MSLYINKFIYFLKIYFFYKKKNIYLLLGFGEYTSIVSYFKAVKIRKSMYAVLSSVLPYFDFYLTKSSCVLIIPRQQENTIELEEAALAALQKSLPHKKTIHFILNLSLDDLSKETQLKDFASFLYQLYHLFQEKACFYLFFISQENIVNVDQWAHTIGCDNIEISVKQPDQSNQDIALVFDTEYEKILSTLVSHITICLNKSHITQQCKKKFIQFAVYLIMARQKILYFFDTVSTLFPSSDKRINAVYLLNPSSQISIFNAVQTITGSSLNTSIFYRFFPIIKKRKNTLWVMLLGLFILIMNVCCVTQYFFTKKHLNQINSSLHHLEKSDLKHQTISLLDDIHKIKKMSVLTSKIFYGHYPLYHITTLTLNNYINFVWLRKIDHLFQQILQDQTLSLAKRYLWFASYLALSSGNEKTINQALLLVNAVHPESFLTVLLTTWQQYRLPSLMIHEEVLRDHKKLFQKTAYYDLWSSLFEMKIKLNIYHTLMPIEKIKTEAKHLLRLMLVLNLSRMKKEKYTLAAADALAKSILSQYRLNYCQYWQHSLTAIHLPAVQSITDKNFFHALLDSSSSFNRAIKNVIKHHQLINCQSDAVNWIRQHKAVVEEITSLEKQYNKTVHYSKAQLLDMFYGTIQGKENMLTQLADLPRLFPSPIDRAVKDAVEQYFKLFTQTAAHYLNAVFYQQIYDFYQKNIADYYPINHEGKGASVKIFMQFFSAEGRLAQFNRSYLTPLLHCAAQDPLSHVAAHIIKKLNFLPQYQQLRAIQIQYASIFNHKFLIEPMVLSKSYQNITVSIDDVHFQYSHGPVFPTIYQWSDGAGNKGIDIVCTDFFNQHIHHTIKSEWAFFKLLSRSTAKPPVHLPKLIEFQAKDCTLRAKIR
jgi:hypothetical protein